ncbi:MAG: hypothetical protein N2Z79_02315, partial [Candidatus Omnitrophica bacterium]|nr:hypothetical protein [Candidatus Omnitrophota bacterium]
MKRYSLKEYFLYIIIKALSKISILLPYKLVIFSGKVLGNLFYYLDRKHRLVAYKNLRMCLASHRSFKEIKMILKKNFQNFGMNLVEVLIIPKIN